MTKKTESTVYIDHPSREERPFGEEEDPVTEGDEEAIKLARLRAELEERLQQSSQRLDGVARKASQLRRQARNKDSASRMRAVVSDAPSKKSR